MLKRKVMVFIEHFIPCAPNRKSYIGVALDVAAAESPIGF